MNRKSCPVCDSMVDEIVRAVAELPDRTSPDDWPEAMIVTDPELRGIINERLGSTCWDGIAAMSHPCDPPKGSATMPLEPIIAKSVSLRDMKMGMAIDPPPKPATSRPIPAPGEPIYAGEPARDNEAPPTMAEYKALVESVRASLDEHYAQRGKHWAYVSLGVGVGIVLGVLLGELIF